MDATVHCVRCGRPDAPALPATPRGVFDAEEIRQKVCVDCFGEWQRVEVMVINELRLDFMDPTSQEVLRQQMRVFLGLDPAPGGAASQI